MGDYFSRTSRTSMQVQQLQPNYEDGATRPTQDHSPLVENSEASTSWISSKLSSLLSRLHLKTESKPDVHNLCGPSSELTINNNTLQRIHNPLIEIDINNALPSETRKKFEIIFNNAYRWAEWPQEREIQFELKLELKKDISFGNGKPKMSEYAKEKLQIILNNLLEKKKIRRSTSRYVSAIWMKKTDGYDLEMHVHYVPLNKKLKGEHCNTDSWIGNQLNPIYGTKWFSVIELQQNFDIKLEETSMKYTSFHTGLNAPFEQFEWTTMPETLKMAPSTIQRFLNKVMEDLMPSPIIVSRDGILVAAETTEQHLNIVKKILEKLVRNKILINLEKSKFLYNEIEYRRYHITEQGIRPADSDVETIQKIPIPCKVKELENFIQLCKYFRSFIEGFGITIDPLKKLAKASKTKDITLDEHEIWAFERLKEQLTSAPILAIYNHKDETELHCDASKDGFGAVLLQRKADSEFHPISYFSKKMTDEERKSPYKSTDWERLAIIHALARFKNELEHIKFKICTDCRAAIPGTKDNYSNDIVIARLMKELQTFDYVFEYRSRDKMEHADALSRFFSE